MAVIWCLLKITLKLVWLVLRGLHYLVIPVVMTLLRWLCTAWVPSVLSAGSWMENRVNDLHQSIDAPAPSVVTGQQHSRRWSTNRGPQSDSLLTSDGSSIFTYDESGAFTSDLSSPTPINLSTPDGTYHMASAGHSASQGHHSGVASGIQQPVSILRPTFQSTPYPGSWDASMQGDSGSGRDPSASSGLRPPAQDTPHRERWEASPISDGGSPSDPNQASPELRPPAQTGTLPDRFAGGSASRSSRYGNNTTGSSHSSSRRTTKPDRFDGKGDWLNYLRHFEMVAGWNEWSDEEKGTQLAMNLSGVARQAWSDSMAAEDPDYHTLVRVMGQRFRPEGQEDAFKAEFRGRSREKAESYLDFGHDLRRLAARAYPRVPYNVREELTKEQFVQSLDMDMRRQIHLAHPATLEAAITLAIEYETMSGSSKKAPVKPTVVAAVKSDAPASSNDTLSGLVQEMRLLRDEVMKPPPCRFCKGRDHPRGQCPEVVCYNCNGRGHLARACKQKDRRYQASVQKPAGQGADAAAAAAAAQTTEKPGEN